MIFLEFAVSIGDGKRWTTLCNLPHKLEAQVMLAVLSVGDMSIQPDGVDPLAIIRHRAGHRSFNAPTVTTI